MGASVTKTVFASTHFPFYLALWVELCRLINWNVRYSHPYQHLLVTGYAIDSRFGPAEPINSPLPGLLKVEAVSHSFACRV